MNMVEEALRYAARGFAVVPVHGKRASIKNWARRATTKPAMIRRWWAEFPSANIGIVPQACGLLVLDVDPRNGGDETLDRFVTLFGRELLDAPTVLSGGAGRHLYFERPDETTVQRIRHLFKVVAGPGIDLPALVVAPPSLHASGEPYRWECGDEEVAPIALPVRVLEAVPPSTNSPLHSAGVSRVLSDAGVPRAVDSLSGRETSALRAKNCGGQNFSAAWEDPRPMLREIAQLAAPLEDGGLRLARWAVTWINAPARRDYAKNGKRGTQAHSRDLYAFALEAVRVYGSNDAPFFAALKLKRDSRDLANASTTTKNRRNPFDDRNGATAYQKALAEPFQELPIDLDGYAADRKTRGAARVYAFLLLEAYRLGVRPGNMQKDSRTIATALGVSRCTVQRWTEEAIRLELLAVLSRGRKRSANDPGCSARYAIRTVSADARRRRTAEIAADVAAASQGTLRPQAAPPAPVRQANGIAG